MYLAVSVMANDRLDRQIAFIVEIDRLKQVYRQTYLMDSSRKENSAEHSWHFALLAIVLAEYADEPMDVLKVVKMALIHDIVEIDAGDVFIYDRESIAHHEESERNAAERLFGILPPDQKAEYRALWEEFEARKTPEARFAAALDRVQPLLHNYYTRGKSWREHGVSSDKVFQINSRIQEGSEELWRYIRNLIEQSIEKGYLEAENKVKQ